MRLWLRLGLLLRVGWLRRAGAGHLVISCAADSCDVVVGEFALRRRRSFAQRCSYLSQVGVSHLPSGDPGATYTSVTLRDDEIEADWPAWGQRLL